ncbi:hypothetical protein [Ruminococcus sp. NK3A76]|uniref:hypothetical protein n=1 Tax=Ruminococcus sp. NK3A76 TaxID=877411 RepID=UPI00048EF01B|nr:hypothetical protein [Ruminococcus sp. NK3A76]
MKTTKKITSEITDGKQIIRFSNTLGKTEYMISIILSASGNGEKDIQNKLKALLEKEISRQLNY